jgi:hypothetical protein
MSDSPLRTAIVGYGLAGSIFHAPLIAATDGLVLTTVVTRNAARAAAAQRRYRDVAIVSTVEEVWRRRKDIDLVVIASPNDTHVPLGLAALDAGLPVVIDKPVAATAAGAYELRDAAAERVYWSASITIVAGTVTSALCRACSTRAASATFTGLNPAMSVGAPKSRSRPGVSALIWRSPAVCCSIWAVTSWTRR